MPVRVGIGESRSALIRVEPRSLAVPFIRLAPRRKIESRIDLRIHQQPFGQGHVIAFAEEPNYRAFTEGTMLLFMNAVMLGPGY